MDELSQQVRALVKDTNANQRKEILDQLHDLAKSLEEVPDTMQRLSYMVGLLRFQLLARVPKLTIIQSATGTYHDSNWIGLESVPYIQ